MRYERAYRGEPDRWEPIGYQHLREVFRQNFKSVPVAVKRVNDGEEVRTNFASYRKKAQHDCMSSAVSM
jgi:hypothetical protein